MTLSTFKIFLLLMFTFVSCQKKSTSNELRNKFYSNQIQFDSLVTALRNNSKLDSLFYSGPDAALPDIKTIYPKEFELLKKLGITAASSHPNVCRVCPRWYYLKTDWPSEHPIYLIYNFTNYSMDSAENIKGFYKKDRYKNETWGLGNNWKMFSFVDTIRDFKY